MKSSRSNGSISSKSSMWRNWSVPPYRKSNAMLRRRRHRDLSLEPLADVVVLVAEFDPGPRPRETGEPGKRRRGQRRGREGLDGLELAPDRPGEGVILDAHDDLQVWVAAAGAEGDLEVRRVARGERDQRAGQRQVAQVERPVAGRVAGQAARPPGPVTVRRSRRRAPGRSRPPAGRASAGTR